MYCEEHSNLKVARYILMFPLRGEKQQHGKYCDPLDVTKQHHKICTKADPQTATLMIQIKFLCDLKRQMNFRRLRKLVSLF